MEKIKENANTLNFLLTHCRHWLNPVPITFSKGKFRNQWMNSLAKSKSKWTVSDSHQDNTNKIFFLVLDAHSGISILSNIYFI